MALWKFYVLRGNCTSQQMTLAEAQTLTLRILKQVMEEKLDQHNVQLAQVRSLLYLRLLLLMRKLTDTELFQ
jgi:hypothetical protein